MKKIYYAFIVFCCAQAHAISIDWSGGYRIEYTEVENTSLSDPAGTKSYGLNYLYLQPKIIGSDGINIISRFDVFGNELPAYRNSQLGSFWGNGIRTTGAGQNVTSQNSDSMGIRVSQLYLNVNHEYGALVAGRAPLEFGMGITHNAGRGEFDHWIDTRDMLGYRFIIDNVSFMPILAKIYQNDFGLATTVSEQTFLLEYDNKDIGAKAGVIHQTRRASDSSNDGAAAGYPGSGALMSGFKSQTVNVFLERKWTSFEFRMEGSFLTGDTGIAGTTGEEIKLNSYAVAAEMLFPANDTKWEFLTKFGFVSGDNPDTPQTHEGYQLDRNYDIAMLLFNHRLGKVDIFGNGPIHSTDGAPNNLTIQNSADDEAIGNTMYLSQSIKYSFTEKFDWKNTLTYAQLMTNTNNFVDFKKDLGLELDMEFIYRPRERVTWSTGVGFLFPGSTWKAGTLDFDNKTTYGLTTKAAITF